MEAVLQVVAAGCFALAVLVQQAGLNLLDGLTWVALGLLALALIPLVAKARTPNG